MKKNNTYTFRPIEPDDAQKVFNLSKKAQGGLSNLPKTLLDTKEIIKKSNLSFKKDTPIKLRKFVFVIEDQNRSIMGISAIKARIGVHRPYYSFYLNKKATYPYVELTKQYLGPTELGSLFLAPKFRGKGVARLLSLSRFLFIHCFNDYFTKTITAEMRGYLNTDDSSPVWNAIGKKFIPIPFNEADIQSMKDDHFIEKHFPKKPIYLALLNKKTQKIIGKVHPLTEPAKNLLLSEGFKVSNTIDIFDGGPTLDCLVKNIRTIKTSKKPRLATSTTT